MLRYAFSVQLSGSFSGSNTTWFISRGIGASLQAREHLVDLLGRQVLVEDVIDHHHRRVVAGGEALLLALQVELAVRRRLAGLDAEPLCMQEMFVHTEMCRRPTGFVSNIE